MKFSISKLLKVRCKTPRVGSMGEPLEGLNVQVSKHAVCLQQSTTFCLCHAFKCLIKIYFNVPFNRLLSR